MLLMIILATLFMASSSARPLFGFEERDQPVSPCFLNCTNVALPIVHCTGITDLPCMCNSATFRNLVTNCGLQFCPNEADEFAVFQASECAAYSTLSASELASGASLTSSPSTPTQTVQMSVTSSSPAPLRSGGGTTVSYPSGASSDTFAHFGNNSNNDSQTSSSHTGIIIGAVVGAIVLMVIIFFLYRWRKRIGSGSSDRRHVRASNRMSLIGGDGIGHSYQGAEATAHPWSYPASTSSRPSPRPFFLSTNPLTKPPTANHQNHTTRGYHELHSPAEPSTSEHSGTSASSPAPSSPPRRLTRSSGQRISMPPPAYQPSSTSAKLGSWKQ
jgi:hypothetical protein